MQQLTQRELEVLHLLAYGNSVSQVAGLLFISVETIRSHRKKIYYKLDINTAIQLGIWIGRNLSLTNLKIA
jgi:DNA-binding CsgD family transcriptional regulator